MTGRGSMPGADRYTALAQLFHWGMLLFVAGLFPLGYVMSGMVLSPDKLQLYSWHKSFGVVVFALTVLRLGWRMLRPPPPPPATVPPHERVAAHAVHALLYICLLALPLSGWIMSSASGLPVVVFRAVQLPDLVGADEPLRLTMLTVHFGIGLAMLALLAVHAAAALYHHFGRRDEVLARMLPLIHRRDREP